MTTGLEDDDDDWEADVEPEGLDDVESADEFGFFFGSLLVLHAAVSVAMVNATAINHL